MPVRVPPRTVLLAAAALVASVLCASAARAQGVVPNGEFDVAAVTEWTGNIATLSWSQTDPDCSLPNASGSLHLSPDSVFTAVSAFLCVALPPASTWNLTFLVRADCQEVVTGTLRYYSATACGGTSLGSDESGGTTLGGTWDQVEVLGAAPPGGTQSVRIDLQLSESLTQICTARFDRVHFGPGLPLLRSGFETGSSACRWSATVP
jgi:hypothetical protein